ncbi:hypothetical protein [uncultured Psychrobacter sp.]|uniref:hypothetical protein n=1 Tax=uncultured Psychrobacter sp. TaxID=259303 RepID=UPI003457D56F
MSVKHQLVIAVGGAVFVSLSGAAAVNTLGFNTVDGIRMALIHKPSRTGGINEICVTGDPVVLGVNVALSVLKQPFKAK